MCEGHLELNHHARKTFVFSLHRVCKLKEDEKAKELQLRGHTCLRCLAVPFPDLVLDELY